MSEWMWIVIIGLVGYFMGVLLTYLAKEGGLPVFIKGYVLHDLREMAWEITLFLVWPPSLAEDFQESASYVGTGAISASIAISIYCFVRGITIWGLAILAGAFLVFFLLIVMGEILYGSA